MVAPVTEPRIEEREQERVARGESREAELEREVERLRRLVADRDDRLHAIQTISRAIGSTRSLDEVLGLIMNTTTQLMNAERATLFLLDEETEELWSKVVQGPRVKEIRLKAGEGIAGWVLRSGKSVNIKDAYRDPRFNRNVDVETGFQTRSCLCQPIRNHERKIIGVVQVLNRRDGYFSVEDEALLSAIASQAAVSIEVSKLYLSVLASNMELIEYQNRLEHKMHELDVLYDIEREAAHAPDLDALLASIAQKCLEALEAQASAITIRREEMLKLHCVRRTKNGEFDISVAAIDEARGAAGVGLGVMRTGRPSLCTGDGEPCVVENPILASVGVETRNVVAVPLVVDDRVLGALEVVNKQGFDERGERRTFAEADLKLLTLIGSHIASAVATQLHRERREKAQRLSAIGQMVSSVLHDLKTPISVVSGYVQLMAREDSRDKRDTYARSILKQFDTLNRMTKEILAFARGDSTILIRKVFMNKFMDEIEQMLQSELAARGVTLELETAYRGIARFDEVKLKRVFANLARNAADAMSQGGHVKMSVVREGEQLVFTFSDNGPGIPAEIRGRLFESFVSRGKVNGTGLGLAIVKKIVDEHNGAISVDSAPGQGTTFVIHLPAEPPENP